MSTVSKESDPVDSPDFHKLLLDAALAYAALGIAVFPCRHSGEKAKAPLTPNGRNDATTDLDQVRKWWGEDFPGAMIGGAMGEQSRGLVVVDIDYKVADDRLADPDDPRTWGAVNGHQTLEALALKGFDWPATPACATTPSHGVHLFFRSRGEAPHASKLPGVDLQGTGSYVILPPSRIVGMEAAYEYVRLPKSVGFDGSPTFLRLLASDDLPEPPSWFHDPNLARDVLPEHFFRSRGASRLATPSRATPAVASEASTLWRRMNEDALANLDAWAPALGLKRLKRRHGGGYSAVAEWRPSNSGRPLGKRGFNLSISPKGIVDFGDGGKTYTAIDLIVAARDIGDPSEAYRWLGEALGMDFTPAITLAPKKQQPGASRLIWHGGTEFEPPRWLVKNLLPASGVALLAGQFASGKTFVGVDLSVSCALGLSFLGRRGKQGAVLWIAAEGSGEVDGRLRAALISKGRDPRENIPFAWTGCSVQLSKPDGIQWLEQTIREGARDAVARFAKPLVLVVIDTLAAAFGLQDENDNAEAARAMKVLADLGNAHGVLVLPVAHLGKNAEAGVRGASAYGAGADAILNVIANGDPTTGKVTSRALALGKSRRGPTGPIGRFELVPVLLGQDEDGDAVTSCAVTLSEGRPEVVTPKTGGRGDVAFHDALNEALAEAGGDHRVRSSGPVVRAVALSIVRNEFDRRYATGEKDARKQTAALRQAWKRALDRSISIRQAVCETLGSIEMIWRL